MIESLLRSITGGGTAKEGEQGRGIGSLIVIGIILFVLLGGMKLLQKPEETADLEC